MGGEICQKLEFTPTPSSYNKVWENIQARYYAPIK